MADTSWTEAWPALIWVPIVVWAIRSTWARGRTRRLRMDRVLAYGKLRGLQRVYSAPAVQGTLHGVFVSVEGQRWSTVICAATPYVSGTVHVARAPHGREGMDHVQTVLLGDPFIDASFVIKSAPPDLAHRWLTPWLRRELLGFGAPGLCLHVREQTVYLEWSDSDREEAAVLDQAMRIVLTATLGRPP